MNREATNQVRPETEPIMRLHENRRADSERVLRKFAISAAIQSAGPGADPEKIVRAAGLILGFLRETTESAP
jgi:hypothetical protein